MNAPKSLLNLMHEIESELQEFCSYDGSKQLVDLIRENDYGFSVKSQENKHLGLSYENVYIAFNREDEPNISFATSGDDNSSDEKRFSQDEKVLKDLLYDLKKLKDNG